MHVRSTARERMTQHGIGERGKVEVIDTTLDTLSENNLGAVRMRTGEGDGFIAHLMSEQECELLLNLQPTQKIRFLRIISL